MPSDPDDDDDDRLREAAGLASVATVSFLAARAAPTGGFAIALAGGAAMARAGQRLGARRGYGASLAAMLESVAIMGPSRVSVPFTQAITAPLVGALEARGARPLAQLAACAGIRLLDNALGTAFLIWIVLGGLDAYAGSYDALLGGLLPEGEGAALALAGLGLVGWAVGASAVAVAVYRRGMARWPAGPPPAAAPAPAPAGPAGRPRVDPRAAALAALVAFALLLSGTSWPLLAGVAAWLALAAPLARSGDRGVYATGAVLAALLGGGALAGALLAGLGADVGLRRALRAALLVAVATWLRAAAGSAGLREVAQRVLARLRRLPAVSETAAVLGRLASDRRLARAGRELRDALAPVPLRPLALLDAILGWVAAQSGRFAPAAVARQAGATGAPGGRDLLVVGAALALPAAGLILGR